jgi:hypothetical protein
LQEETTTLITVRFMTLFFSVFRTSIPLIATGIVLFNNISSLSQIVDFYTNLMLTSIPLYFVRAYDSIKTFQILNCYTFPCKFNYVSMEKFYWLIIRTPIYVIWYAVHVAYSLVVSPIIDLYVLYLSVINYPSLR